MVPKYPFCALSALLIFTASCSMIPPVQEAPLGMEENCGLGAEAWGLRGSEPTPCTGSEQVVMKDTDFSPPIQITHATKKPDSATKYTHAGDKQQYVTLTKPQVQEQDSDVGETEERTLHPAAIAGLILTILGGGILSPIGWVGIILSVVALKKIKTNPDIYYGKGLAITSMIYFIISIFALIALIIFAIYFSGIFLSIP